MDDGTIPVGGRRAAQAARRAAPHACAWLACLALAAGCATAPPARTMLTLAGTVTYLQRSALPPDAVLNVQLQDVSRADAPAIIVAEHTVPMAGRQVPVPWALAYDEARIDPRGRYVVRATLRAGGRLLFTSTDAYPVITQGAPLEVAIRVNPAAASH